MHQRKRETLAGVTHYSAMRKYARFIHRITETLERSWGEVRYDRSRGLPEQDTSLPAKNQGKFFTMLQRDIPMFLSRVRIHFLVEDLQGSDQAGAGFGRFDDRVDIPVACRQVGMGEHLAIV